MAIAWLVKYGWKVPWICSVKANFFFEVLYNRTLRLWSQQRRDGGRCKRKKGGGFLSKQNTIKSKPMTANCELSMSNV